MGNHEICAMIFTPVTFSERTKSYLKWILHSHSLCVTLQKKSRCDSALVYERQDPTSGQ